MSLLIHGGIELSVMITLTVFIKGKYSCTKYSSFCQVMATTAECSHHFSIIFAAETTNKVIL